LKRVAVILVAILALSACDTTEAPVTNSVEADETSTVAEPDVPSPQDPITDHDHDHDHDHTHDVADNLEAELVALLSDSSVYYPWGSYSDNTKNLQAVLGISADGVYGPNTKATHQKALDDRGITATNVSDAESAPTSEDVTFSWNNPNGYQIGLMHTLLPDTTSEFIETKLYIHNSHLWGTSHQDNDNYYNPNNNLTYEYTPSSSLPFQTSQIHAETCSAVTSISRSCTVTLSDRSHWTVHLAFNTATSASPYKLDQVSLPSLNYVDGWNDQFCADNASKWLVTHANPSQVPPYVTVHPDTQTRVSDGACSLSRSEWVERNYVEPIVDAAINIMPQEIKDFTDWHNVYVGTDCRISMMMENSGTYLHEGFDEYIDCNAYGYYINDPYAWVTTNSVVRNLLDDALEAGDRGYLYTTAGIYIGGVFDNYYWDDHVRATDYNALTTMLMHELAHAVDFAIAKNRIPGYTTTCGDWTGYNTTITDQLPAEDYVYMNYEQARIFILSGFHDNGGGILSPTEVAPEVIRNLAMKRDFGIPMERGRFRQGTSDNPFYEFGEDIYDNPIVEEWAAFVLDEGLDCVQDRIEAWSDSETVVE